jgi:hypothetical protein
MVPYTTTWARVYELLNLSAALREQSRAIRNEAERTHTRLEALGRRAESLRADHQAASPPTTSQLPC